MSLVQQHILTAFRDLGQGVTLALQTQLGDTARLNEHKRRCLQFLADIQQVSFPGMPWLPYAHELLFSTSLVDNRGFGEIGVVY